jgi:hypothetical protein
VDVEDSFIRRRDVNGSPYHLGVRPIVFRRSSSRLRPELFAAGAFLGAAFLLKQPAAIAAVPLGIYLLLPSYRASRSLTRTNSIIQAATLTAGFFAVLGLVTIVRWSIRCRRRHVERDFRRTYGLLAKPITGLGDFDVRHHEQERLDSFSARNMLKAAHA